MYKDLDRKMRASETMKKFRLVKKHYSNNGCKEEVIKEDYYSMLLSWLADERLKLTKKGYVVDKNNRSNRNMKLFFKEQDNINDYVILDIEEMNIDKDIYRVAELSSLISQNEFYSEINKIHLKYKVCYKTVCREVITQIVKKAILNFSGVRSIK